MRKKEFKGFRETLDLKREARQSLNRLKKETRSLELLLSQSGADLRVVNLSNHSLFERASQRRGFVRRIEGAVERIDGATFGICVGLWKTAIFHRSGGAGQRFSAVTLL